MSSTGTPARSSWSGKWAFILAAAASAVGLGNMWRFPYLAAKYGGGTFLLTYLVLVFTFGVSLLLLETALGRKTGQSAIGAFKQFGARLLGGAQHLLRVGTQRCERIRIGLAILLLLQLRLKLQNGLVIGLHLLAKTVHRLLSGGERLVDPIFVVPPQHDWELVHHGAFLSRIPSLTLTFRALSVCTLAHPEHETHGSRIILTQRTGISQKSSTSSQQNVAG